MEKAGGLEMKQYYTAIQKYLFLLILIHLFAEVISVNGANRYAVASGNWNATSTWSASPGGASGASVPGVSDIVYIEGGKTVTVNANTQCASLIFDPDDVNNNVYLQISTGITLQVTNDITLNNGGWFSVNATISGDGTLSCATVNIGNNASPSQGTFVHKLETSISSFIITGNLTINSKLGNNNKRIANGVFSQLNGVVTINGNIITSNADAVNSSSFIMGNASPVLNLGGSNPFNLSSTGTNTITLNSSGATVNYNRSGDQTVGNFNYYNLIFTGSGVKTLQTGTTIIGGNLTIDNASTSAVIALTIGGDVILERAFSFTAGAFTHTVGGNWTKNGWGTFTATGSTINFTGNSSAINGTQNTQLFNNVIISKTSGQLLGSGGNITTININGDLTLTSGSFAPGSISTVLSGNWINNGGSLTSGSGAITMNGSGKSIGGTNTTTFNNLTINNNTGGILLARDQIVNGTLTLSNGLLKLGAYNLTLGATAPAMPGPFWTANMVVADGTGELRKIFTSNGSYTFPVGDNADGTANFSPVTLTFNSGAYGSGAYAGVRVTDAKHPSNTSTTNYLTRYWSVSQSGISSFSCDFAGTYEFTGDVVGQESLQTAAQYTGALPWVTFSALGGNTLTAAGISSFGAFTGIQVADITSTQTALSGFSYTQGAGPSPVQSFAVSGVNLTAGIVLTPPAGFEISTNSNSGYQSTPLTIPQSGGFVYGVNIYVRLKAGLTGGNYSGNITLSSSGAATRNVQVSGNVIGGTTVNTGVIAGSPFCAGSSVSVPFTISGSFNAGNIFTAQLSNSTGSFTSPVSIGTLTSTSGGTINATIPVATSTGTGYRIRVVSSNPAITGSANGIDLLINARLTAVSLSPTVAQNICGSTSGTSLTVTETDGGTIVSRQWGKRAVSGGAITPIAGATGQTYTPNGIDLASGTWYIVCTSTPGCGSAVVSNEIKVTVNALPSAPVVGTITHPSCSVATGSVQLTGLPATGSWTLTRTPGAITATGSGTSILISGLASGTYTFTVTNADGCTSVSSSNIVINAQPSIPTITDIMPSSRCGAGTLTLGAIASEGTVNWYAAETGGSLLGTGNTFTTPSISVSTNYYAEAINGGCISSSRVAVLASVITPPTITASGGGTYCSGSTVNLFSSSANITNQYWTGPNSYYSLLANPILSNVMASMSGTYRVTGSALSGINLVTNGDFEMGNTGFTSDYARAAQTTTGLNPEGTYDIVAAPSSRHTNFCSCPDHTSGSGTLQMVINGASTEKNVWAQTVNVNPNTAYQFTYWVQTVVNGNDASPSKLQLYINGKFAGPVYTANPTTGVWTQFTYNWTSGPGDLQAALVLKNENFATGGNDFALDDIIFQQACEDYDEVVVNVNDAVTAGSINANQNICSGSTPATLTSTLAGTGSGTITYEWETNASGSYVIIPGATSPNYSPPALNSTTSYRRRTVSDNGGVLCYSSYTNIVTVTISGPVAEAGEPLDICQPASPSAIMLTGASVGGGATTGAWSIISGGGTLSTTGQTNPATVTYTPVPGYSGTVVLRLTSNQVGACAAIDEKTINIAAASFANAGVNISTCSNSGETIITEGSSAENYTALAWTSNGSGTFTNANSLTLATYTPGPSDIVNGEVTLTLTAYGNTPCGNVSSTKKIFIKMAGSWTGAIDREWNNPGNWACNQLPTIFTNVTIANGLPNYPVVSSDPAGMAKDITIGSNASVTVTGGTLQIGGSISNSGNFTATEGTIEMKGSAAQTIGANVFNTNTLMNLIINNPTGVTLQGPLNITGYVRPLSGDFNSSGNLTLVSTAAQTALIEGSGTGTVKGIVNIQRYLPSSFGYKYFSSPFQSATVGAFASAVNLTETFPTFYRYDENNSIQNPDKSISYKSGWVKYTAIASPLTPMAGYAANLGTNTSPQTITISGQVNNGALSLALENNDREFSKGFNLVGNPYPSPIDWDAAGWTKTNIDNAIYFFNAGNTDRYTGVYSSYVNGKSSDNVTGVIAAMQGFFVHVSDGSYPVKATLGATNSVRINNLNPGFKDATIDTRPTLRLKAGFEIKDAIHDAAVIYFDPTAGNRFEQDKDALKLNNTDILVPNIYTMSPDGSHLSINGLSLASDSLSVIPVGITTFSPGWINLRAENVDDLTFFEQVILKDASTGQLHDLRRSADVRFYLDKGTYDRRFSLLFSKEAINNDNPLAEKLFTLVRSGNTVLVKVNLAANTKGNLVVTNLLGQTLLQKEVVAKETVEISRDLSTGVYVITLVSGKRTASEKILMRTDYE